MDELVSPADVDTLDDVDLPALEECVRAIRKAAGSLSSNSRIIDVEWGAHIGLHYVAPNGTTLARQMTPVRARAQEVTTALQKTADALQEYAVIGASVKRALLQLKRDAEDLTVRARALGPAWRDEPGLVEENERIAFRTRDRARDHEQAQQAAVDTINATNDGAGVNGAILLSEYLGFGKFATTAVSSTKKWKNTGSYGRFAPPGGAYRLVPSPDGTALWMRRTPIRKDFKARLLKSNWTAKRGFAEQRATWSRIGTVSRRSSIALSGVTAGLEQWGKDSRNPRMSWEKRSARTAIKGGAAAAGTWAGTEAGTATGAAIGLSLGPAGAAVGAVTGGIVGAAIGSGVAGAAADGVNDWIGT